jgi:hypothetical protein
VVYYPHKTQDVVVDPIRQGQRLKDLEGEKNC